MCEILQMFVDEEAIFKQRLHLKMMRAQAVNRWPLIESSYLRLYKYWHAFEEHGMTDYLKKER